MQGTSSNGGGFLGGMPRSVLLMISVLLINNLAVSYLIIYISAYLPEVGVSTSTVGILLGVEGIAMAVFAIPFGILSDRRGRKHLLILGSIGPVPMFFAFALTTDAFVMAAAACLGGIFEGTYLATVNAIIADQTTLKNRDATFTLSFILGGAGSALGTALPFFIPELSRLFGVGSAELHTDILYLFGFLSLMIPAALYAILRNVQEAIRPTAVEWKWNGRGIRTLLKFSGINSIMGLGAGFIIPLIPTWLWLRFGVPDAYSGPILAIASTTIGLGAAFSPRLAFRIGSVRAVVLTQGLSLALMLTLAFVGDFQTAAIFYVVRTGLMNMASPLLDAYLMGIVPPDQRGFASAVNSVVWRIPNSVTTIAGGVILAAGYFELPFLLAGSFYIASIFLFYRTFKDVKPTG